jgi:putative hydrolase
MRFTVAARTQGRAAGGVMGAPSRVGLGSVSEVDAETRRAVDALNQIGYLLERTREPTYRVRAFRNAATKLVGLDDGELVRRSAEGTLEELAGIGKVTAGVIAEAVAGEVPAYLVALTETADGPLTRGGGELRAALRGDLHTHSDWSDGGSPIEEMMRTAAALGHEYAALTDHSPRLTVARGLSPERLREQLGIVRRLNEELAPFRILTGIEVDILDDGALDQEPELLAELDVVVASVHSKLRMPREQMTMRMVAAIANPHMDVLGHCTGRLVVGRGRPESEFDAEVVFEACRQFGVAVEINSRPERLDPPRRLLSLAVEMGCMFSIDTDAHAPGQLEWQLYGCERAEECGVTADRVINTKTLADLQSWLAP